MHAVFSLFQARLFLLIAVLSFLISPTLSIAQKSGPIKSYYSPIVRLEVEKGFLMIATDSGVLWVQVEDHVKPHLKTLEVGNMIDVTVQYRSNNLAPLLQSWKLASGSSSCKIFDGKTCSK